MLSRTLVFEHESPGPGMGLSEGVVMPIEALDGKDILSLSGNGQGDKVLITTRDGSVLFNKNSSLLQSAVPWQHCVELESQSISHIDSSDNYHVGLNENGDVFTWEDEDTEVQRREPSYLPVPKMLNLQQKVVQVSCGERHTVCLTEEGRVGVWGSNSEGQLGLGDQAEKLYTEPQFIDCLKGVLFIQVVAGGYHTMCLSGSSAVFGWGRNSSGQLGTPRKDKQMDPVWCHNVRSKGIKFISCGENHTAMLSKDGSIFSFGLDFKDGNGELPDGEIQFLRDKPVSSIACGLHHTVAFLAESGQTFVFGPVQEEVSLVQLVEEHELNSEKERSRGSILFTAHNRTFVHMSRFPKADVVRETMDKMLLLDRVKSDCLQDGSDEYLKQRLAVSLSSPSCLNGSFLSSDAQHRECSRLTGHGVDMEKVTSFFRFLKDKCLDSDVVSTTVREAWQKLISELHHEPCHVEALRLYLIIPFCHIMEDGASTFPEIFAKSWIELNKKDKKKVCHNILNQWLKIIPVDCFKRQLEVLTKSIRDQLPKSKELYRIWRIIPKGVQSCIRMMDILYKVNEKRDKQVHRQEFYVPELSTTIDIQEDYRLSLNTLDFHFCKFPFLYNPESKGILLKSQNKRAMEIAFWTKWKTNPLLVSPFLPHKTTFILKVNRDRIIEETKKELLSLQTADKHIHKEDLIVNFTGENAGGQGVCQEFFTLLFHGLLQQDLLQNIDESNLLWFKPLTSDGLELLKFFGFMLGLAVYNGKLVDLQFPLALYKKLLNVQVTFEDFEELKPTVAKSIKEYILGQEIDGEFFFEQMVEIGGKKVCKQLCENGEEKLVTQDNKQEYVDLKVDFQLNRSIEQEFTHFREGFFEAFDERFLSELKFQPTELKAVIAGKEKFDVTELRRNVCYEASYHADHPVIVSFWEVLTAMDADDRKSFVRFITGTERIPHSGLGLEIRPLEKEGENTDDLIPVVATCSNVLFLPSIADPERLKNRLYQAIANKDKNRFTSLAEALGS